MRTEANDRTYTSKGHAEIARTDPSNIDAADGANAPADGANILSGSAPMETDLEEKEELWTV